MVTSVESGRDRTGGPVLQHDTSTQPARLNSNHQALTAIACSASNGMYVKTTVGRQLLLHLNPAADLLLDLTSMVNNQSSAAPTVSLLKQLSCVCHSYHLQLALSNSSVALHALTTISK